ncbi:hypothetical protein DGG96_11225 [Legionella qingyii]|uniref:Vir protein n=1 Tax=Legionella qingyii TaxID=2184757 RepID=A0A317U2V9_9GAMM|nr:hypothetical protein [Legionella qingyii]PWY54622.1 hypothetical protein DGG96_16505 [Legionella qingyii]PWY55565.1 hypothetical protein DGG96_11225 [Legionella qingyii]RUR21514.1 hypothetical protein ELY20_12400 [Legionella qingyii]
MDFVINSDELAAMSGLPHIQQLAYLRGIRPYMDVKTGITGIKRRVSYQSISEQLYIEPHQGIKSQNFSRDQVRRAISGLVRAGIIEIQSEGMQLILKCLLASKHYSVQNKAAINPPQKATTNPHEIALVNTEFSEDTDIKADIDEPQKAATPLIKENNYIYLLRQFDNFWLMYPEKKSRDRAFEIFQQINPDEHLLQTMLQALDSQIKAHKAKEAHGEWVPAWKFPANWLSQKCWEDEVTIELKQEKRNEKHRASTGTAHDPFWNEDTEDSASSAEDEYQQTNVVSLQWYRQAD